ncbi:hypothetical protein OOT00_04105 [Desulfobotulus sp. H1]|uniref:DUF3788 family protein n=1 Tax=Desulfobotulus pelophilus TaxID=2823377 RepID=A0ABT3N7M5_9BACT|nr:hypothetical protein [Desulfobotulus pelophilus]MCW7753166.1 hypothetical protein [Desulfobotulus pelophilus]
MLAIEELKNNLHLLNEIDWELTPEDAVNLYLEWGGIWKPGGLRYSVRGKHDKSFYFTVNTWEDTPVIYLIRRNSEEAVELARIPLPPGLKETFLESIGHNRGVYALEGEVKDWLQKKLYH